MSLYTVSTRRPCPRCGFRIDGEQHFRACVPAAEWPATMAPGYHVPRVVIDGLVYDADKVPDAFQSLIELEAHLERTGQGRSGGVAYNVGYRGDPHADHHCDECGFVAKSALGLRSHQRKHAVNV